MAQRHQAADRDGDEGAEHEERPVSEVHHPERAEDQRQSERDQRIGAALVEPVEDLEEDGVHDGGPSCGTPSICRRENRGDRGDRCEMR